jgi:hypothetical protein
VAALIPKIAKQTRTEAARINIPSLPFNLKLVSLSDSRGILLTINNDRIIVRTVNNNGEPVIELNNDELE